MPTYTPPPQKVEIPGVNVPTAAMREAYDEAAAIGIATNTAVPVTAGFDAETRDRKKKLRYARALGPTLRAAMEEHLALTPAERFDLSPELAIVQKSVEPMLALYSAALEIAERQPDNDALQEVLAKSASMLRGVLKEVAEFAQTAASVDAMSKDKVSVLTLYSFVDQLMAMMYDSFKDDPSGTERLRNLEMLFRTRLRIVRASGNEDAGTRLTPEMTARTIDDAVIAMDMTVPTRQQRPAGPDTPVGDHPEVGAELT